MQLSPTAKVVFLGVLVVLAFGLRADGLSAAGLSEDEVNKLVAARGYLAGDFTENREHPMMMKLQIAACLAATDAWNARFGDVARVPEEVPVRLPNVLFGALTTIVLFFVVEQYFGTATGLLAAALWATGISAIAINRIAKEDTLLVFFYWSCLYFYERAKRFGTTPEPGRERAYRRRGAWPDARVKVLPPFWACCSSSITSSAATRRTSRSPGATTRGSTVPSPSASSSSIRPCSFRARCSTSSRTRTSRRSRTTAMR